MNATRTLTLLAAALALSAGTLAPAYAKSDNAPAAAEKHLRHDTRYGHNRYYPSVGYSVNALPRGYTSVRWGGGHYYHHHGAWYRYRGGRYVVIAPPFGVTIPILPLGYTSLYIGGVPYFYADDVYYRPVRGGYAVVEPPPGEVTWHPDAPPAAPAATDTLVITPRNNQTDTQRSFDRIDCEKAASQQTGFDPNGASADAVRKADYIKAVAACLEGKGYSVK